MTKAEKILWLVDVCEGGKKGKFAKTAGFDPSYISKLSKEPNYEPSDRLLKAICDAYGCNWDWIANDIGEAFPPKTREEEIGQIALEASKENIDEAVAFYKEWFGDLTDAEILTMYRIWKRKKQREKQK